jgi:hypothetical protein
MANRGLTTRIPIWVRVPAIIALVLVGVLLSTMLLDAVGGDGGRGSGDETEMTQHTGGGDHGGGGHGSGSGHGSGGGH